MSLSRAFQRQDGSAGVRGAAWFGRVVLLGALVGTGVVSLRASDTFTKPTKEELAMTSLPGYPGAPAVVLYREEVTDDNMHAIQHYARIKILTEEGKSEANVEIRYSSVWDSDDGYAEGKSVGDVIGRTIHADGTIIPFTGKPYLKTIEKGSNFRYQASIFTLPDVEVGSIIEYRYATRYNDNVVEAPAWMIQGPLFVKQAHYVWTPSHHDVTDNGGLVTSIAWYPVLPEGVQLQHRDLPQNGTSMGPSQLFELTVKDIAPQPKEEFMPPIASFTYRVQFYYTSYRTGADFWKGEGRNWSKRADSFIGPNSAVKAQTQTVIAGAATQDEKLRKIYAAVEALENTHYTREHERREDKAAGFGAVNNTADVLEHKRGNEIQLTELFIAMARAAGMKAYLMVVPDRTERIFAPNWLSFVQFDDPLAIVTVDGKEAFFDPGSRYCAYGHLAWQDTFIQGLRQTDGGTDFAETPGDSYKMNATARVANLNMTDQGGVSGTIDLTFSGAPALRWRQDALSGDSESLHHDLREYLEHMLPKTMEVRVTNVANLEDYERPLKVTYEVKGELGQPTGKRLVLPVDVFTAEAHATFPHDKREEPIYFHYPQHVQDGMRINLPKSMSIEAAPASSKLGMPQTAAYALEVTAAANSVTVRRDYGFNSVILPTTDYPALRTFYSQFEAKDQESVVLKAATAESAAAEKPGN